MGRVNKLYVSGNGQNIVTHSMMKCFRRCPQQANYKYMERLKVKVGSTPLERGKWLHALLEAYYRGEDWTVAHALLTSKFHALFDEEKEALGDLPTECEVIFKSYLWHYAADPTHGWKVHDVEFAVETELPDGSLYRGIVDLMVEDQFGLWLVDHKTHKTLPRGGFRLRDPQSALYLWAALRSGLDVQGFIWNYIRTTAPATPKLAYAGTPRQRLSKQLGETDYPTAYRGIKALGLDPRDHTQLLKPLLRDRWVPDGPQTSPFFQRATLEKGSPVLERVAREAYHTHRRMLTYNFEVAERVVDRSCDYMCSFNDLCAAELYGLNGDNIRRQRFKVGDPHDYQSEHMSKHVEEK